MHHPNVIQFYDFFERQGFFCIVTELMRGGDLYDRIYKRGPYNEKSARALMGQLLKGIEYTHSLHIVHRDLKPENILLCSDVEDSDIKIADFGLAAIVKDEIGLYELVGTHCYLAPEVLRRENYGKCVDIWSCGVIMYIVLCGKHPFYQGKNPTQFMAQLREYAKVLSFTSQGWERISPEAKHLVSLMLAVDTNTRITAKQALEHAWIQGKGDVLAQEKIEKIICAVSPESHKVVRQAYNIDKILSKEWVLPGEKEKSKKNGVRGKS